jgi:hypothetical protein
MQHAHVVLKTNKGQEEANADGCAVQNVPVKRFT